MLPKISIAIPVMNAEKFLGEAIESAIKQENPADEVLVYVHDCTDKSIEIAKNYNGIRIIEENLCKNMGQAWNRLYELATCEWVIMLHADDILDKFAVKKIKSYININITSSQHMDMIVGRTLIKSDNNIRVNYNLREIVHAQHNFYQSVMKGFLPGMSGMCIKRDTLLKNRFREDLEIILDIEFYLRCSLKLKVKVVPDILATYRVHNNSALQRDRGRLRAKNDVMKLKQIIDTQDVCCEPMALKAYHLFINKYISKYMLEAVIAGDYAEADNFNNMLYKCKDGITCRAHLVSYLLSKGGSGIAAANLLCKVWNKINKMRRLLI